MNILNFLDNCAFITGGLGFIGSRIAYKLLEENGIDNVISLNHYGRYTSTTREDFSDYRKFRLPGFADRVIIERGEAKHPLLVIELLTKYQPKYIFHLAALPLAKLDNLNSAEATEGSILSTTYQC